MGMEALLSPATLAWGLKAAGITHGRLDIHPTTQALVLSIAQRGKVHHIDVPIGATFTTEEICDLLTRPPTAAAAADPHGVPCKPFGPDGPDYTVRILGKSPP